MNIGDVEIPIVSEISPSSEARVDEIRPLKSYSVPMENIAVKHEPSVMEITIFGFLNTEVHSSHLSIDAQESDVDSLRKTSKLDNSFNYRDYKGHLLIEDVDILQDGNSRIVKEVEIVARYFPWPKYYPESEPS